MKEKNNKTNQPGRPSDGKNNLSGYPAYPASEDIYRKYEEEKDINPEDISKIKEANDITGSNNEKDFNDDESGNDLDIPGTEMDDNQEAIGSEDEENNYYSLGGDNHNDLEEDNGD
jgi:hypothetical protein